MCLESEIEVEFCTTIKKNNLKYCKNVVNIAYLISKSSTVNLPFQPPLHSCMHNNKNNLLQGNHQNTK